MAADPRKSHWNRCACLDMLRNTVALNTVAGKQSGQVKCLINTLDFHTYKSFLNKYELWLIARKWVNSSIRWRHFFSMSIQMSVVAVIFHLYLILLHVLRTCMEKQLQRKWDLTTVIQHCGCSYSKIYTDTKTTVTEYLHILFLDPAMSQLSNNIFLGTRFTAL